jgi:hypothetical protein
MDEAEEEGRGVERRTSIAAYIVDSVIDEIATISIAPNLNDVFRSSFIVHD